jgi:hypothetical protein
VSGGSYLGKRAIPGADLRSTGADVPGTNIGGEPTSEGIMPVVRIYQATQTTTVEPSSGS